MKKIILVLTVALFASANLHAQGEWTHFTKKEGLASNWIRDCVEDQQGNLWFATDHGLNKFDGETFTTLDDKDGLPDGFVVNVYIDKDDNIWMLNGKNAYNILLNDIVYKDVGISVLSEGAKINSLNVRQKEYRFGVITEDSEGNIWLGGYNAREEKPFIIKNFDGDSWENFEHIEDSNCLPFNRFFVDTKGNIWTVVLGGDDDHCFQKFDGDRWVTYGVNDGFPSKARDRIFNLFFEDSNGNIWLAANSDDKYGSLMKFDGSSWTNYSESGSIGSGVKVVLEDNDGKIWIATTKGVNVISPASFDYYSGKEYLPHDYITTMIVDSRNRVWIGTPYGLALYDNGNWSTVTSKNGLAQNHPRAIMEDSRGNIWVGAASAFKKGGPSVYNDDTWELFKEDKLPDFLTQDLFEDSKGNIWILSLAEGLFRYTY